MNNCLARRVQQRAKPAGPNANDSVPLDWTIVGTGDFNGEGRDDILWRNTDGRLTNWPSGTDGAFPSNSASAYLQRSSRLTGGIGDFKGDGRGDILWRNSDGG